MVAHQEGPLVVQKASWWVVLRDSKLAVVMVDYLVVHLDELKVYKMVDYQVVQLAEEMVARMVERLVEKKVELLALSQGAGKADAMVERLDKMRVVWKAYCLADGFEYD